MQTLVVRRARRNELEPIRQIYNEGIEDRLATLDRDPKSLDEMSDWWARHDERYVVLVAVDRGEVAGWAALNRFSERCAHADIADLSVYVRRSHRGQGAGRALVTALVEHARESRFHKIVLHALNANEFGKRLYRRSGFREVGVFEEHGTIEGRYVDVVVMERLLQGRSPEANLGRAGFEPA